MSIKARPFHTLRLWISSFGQCRPRRNHRSAYTTILLRCIACPIAKRLVVHVSKDKGQFSRVRASKERGEVCRGKRLAVFVEPGTGEGAVEAVGVGWGFGGAEGFVGGTVEAGDGGDVGDGGDDGGGG